MTVLNFTPASLTLIPWMESAVRSPSSLGFFTLLRAVHAGRIALTAVTGHRTVWTPRSIKSTLPTVVLISNDDDATESYDPDEFRCSMSAIAWARAGLVHAAKAEVEHYEIAIATAEVSRRFILVETDSAHALAWRAALDVRQIPAFVVIPRPGCVHPITPKRRAPVL